MKLVDKTKLLIIGSICTLLALTAIQVYLIRNTYQLKRATAQYESQSLFTKIYNSEPVEYLLWELRNDAIKQAQAYKNKQISKEEVITNIQQKAATLNPYFLEEVDKGFSEYTIPVDISVQKTLIAVVLHDTLGNAETIYKEKDSTLLLLGTPYKATENSQQKLINNATFTKGLVADINGKSYTYMLELKTKVFMSESTGWSGYLIKQMSGVLLLACLLFLFVTGILFYSIQSLLKQKKLADIKTDFINNITHELKTPLSTLAIAIKNLNNEASKYKGLFNSGVLEVINRQNLRLQKLIDQVLNTSLGYEEIELNQEIFNMPQFLRETVDDFKLSLKEDIDISTNIRKDAILISADKFYISTAINNLLSNAVKYGSTSVSLDYDYIPKERTHFITIKDNGIGIPKKHQRFIFDKFYRVSEQDTHNYKGLGLGLFYTHQIIEAHSGKITVSSNKGNGTEFTIILFNQ
ncbi:sensor histidine kinase KdpD [Mangrovimonas sp. TPBH4]|uniref:sensor histidine kinase n=1 Tax=Mangrovimonas sp. TPBH4 TaxID=1645914 RepID=UPI0006B652B6|nr:HAMP domain-containing sensor histidine kinase [Mangrovimonas sp. TPBH4]